MPPTNAAHREVRAEYLTPAELDDALREASIVYLPLGSIEFHGPHLPVGLDAMNAHGVCVAAAVIGGGVVAPPVYQGIGGGHSDYPWTIMMRSGDALASQLWDTLERLQDLGVALAVIFTGHFAGEQLDAIDTIAREWSEGGQHRLRVIATGVNRCDSSPIAPDHAGIFETTLLYAIEPELVHVELLPARGDHPSIDPGGDSFGAHRHEPSHPLWGVFGPDPRDFDREAAPGLLSTLAGWLANSASDALRT
ncbi:MAG: creatinine amidohydrolase [Actinomycetota bacterium]|nr:creatinine amidohydrolase [Actinomycetota bacterium]